MRGGPPCQVDHGSHIHQCLHFYACRTGKESFTHCILLALEVHCGRVLVPKSAKDAARRMRGASATSLGEMTAAAM